MGVAALQLEYDFEPRSTAAADPVGPVPLSTIEATDGLLRIPSSAISFNSATSPSGANRSDGGTGVQWGSPYQKLWFEQLHLLPARLDLGNVLSTQTTPVAIWNAFQLTDITVTSIGAPGGQGITLSNLPPLPLTLAKTSDSEFTVQVEPNGPPVINVPITVETSIGTRELGVTGRRITPLGFQFQRPIREELVWETVAITAEDGSEQRYANRNAPAQLVTVDMRLTGQDAARFGNLAFDWLSRVFALPIWWEQSALESSISGGSTDTITVDTASADYRIGGLAIIWQSGLRHEVFEVADLTATTITATTPFVANYSPGAAIVAPARLAIVTDEPSESVYPNGVIDVSATLEVIDNEPVEVVAFDETYAGELLLAGDNIIDGVTLPVQWRAPRARTQFGRRRPATLAKSDRNYIAFPWSTRLESKAEVWKLRSWLHQLDGGRITCYVPSGRPDFVLRANITPSTTSVDVGRTEYTSFVQLRPPRDVIRILLRDGTSYIRVITAATTIDEETERLTIESQLGAEVTIEQVDRIEFLYRARLTEGRSAAYTHDEAGVATLALSLRTVRE